MAADLSPQERRVLTLCAAGHDDDAISRRMGITANTLRTYWTRVRTKLGEGTKTRLVVLALRRGEIRVPGLVAEDRVA